VDYGVKEVIVLFCRHILLEAFCSLDDELECELTKNELIKKRICVDCFSSDCKYLLYTQAPDEIAITNEDGISIHDIALDDRTAKTENERKANIQMWDNICKAKIDEALDEYIKQKKLLSE